MKKKKKYLKNTIHSNSSMINAIFMTIFLKQLCLNFDETVSEKRCFKSTVIVEATFCYGVA